MTNWTILIILLSTLLTYGQKTNSSIKSQKTLSDSILFEFLPYGIENQYVLKRVRQFQGQDIYNLSEQQLFFLVSNVNAFLNPGCIKTEVADTLISMQWDSNEKEVNNTTAHLMGIVTFNRSTNIIITKVAYRNKKTRNCEYYSKLYKIKKMTRSEIILLDLTNKGFNRTFYFRRKSTN